MSEITREFKHSERRYRKYQTLEGLKSLYASWEGKLEVDDEYLKHLRERIHRCEVQLANMRP